MQSLHEFRFAEIHSFSSPCLLPISGSGDLMFEKSVSHIGPLYWFPDKCCLIPGHEPAASPSFLHTTFKRKQNILIVLFHTDNGSF